jgi:molybdenum cofactor synthesis domain-containing protein
MAKEVELVSVGNELLIGKTLNTNAQWLAKRATSLGLHVGRITVIGDEVTEIAKALQEIFSRGPAFVITTGGLGPTFDDKTLEGIAKALNSKLVISRKALKMVEDKYAEYAEKTGRNAFDLTSPRTKMARLPVEAEPLPNPAGTAPGVVLRKDQTTVFVLPGVPSEMEAIFERSLLPVLKAAGGDQMFFETSLYVVGVMESEMAPLIDQVMQDNSRIYVKSHPMGAEKKPRLELHLSTMAKDVEEAKRRLGKALAQLVEMVREKGGKTRTANLPGS